ncbi:pentatricopeptide repeat-containing protein At3g18020 [Benincasa hispida]|uniref:pentatricopeptide repeat-containing protein At3g18020 n=1 Tax=Benincasa hispida TaxID=102211 RepID=UPI0019019510|nr:pentatricopeptide repeat-containing protein At3g18020 [Benincasa hispida]
MFRAADRSLSIKIAPKIVSITPSISFLFTRTANFLRYQPEKGSDGREWAPEESVADVSYWTKKIHGLCTKDRNVDEALRLLDALRLHGYQLHPLNLGSIIHGLCDARRFHEAHCRFMLSVASRCVPDERTCNVLLARLLDSRSPYCTLRLLVCLFDAKPEFVPSIVNYNRLIDQFCSFSLPNVAHRVLFDMKSRGHRPNVVSYTALIDGYCRVGNVSAAEKLFEEMPENDVEPNSLAYSVLIHGILYKRDFETGKALMCKLWERMKGEMDSSVNSAAFAHLVDSLCLVGSFHEVFLIAEDMPQGQSVPEEFAYGQMIDSLCKAKRHHGASRIVYIMRKKGINPGLLSYNSIIHGLSKEGSCMRAYQLLVEGVEFGYSPSEYTYKVLLEGLCNVLDVQKAKEVLQIMIDKEGVDRTRIYNIYLRAVCLTNNSTELLNTLVEMLRTNCHPDVITLNTVIKGFCKVGSIEEALKVLNDMMIGKFCTPDSVTFTTMICGLLIVGRIRESLDILYKVMPEKGIVPGVITYNATIRGLFKLQQANQAMDVFDRMVRNGIQADSTTYAAIIDGLCDSNQIEEVKRFWKDIVWPSKIHDSFVYSAILKGLCHSSKFNEACHFLYELADSGVSPSIFCYNIVINTACKLGLKGEAYRLVTEMRKNGLAPDAVTWRILHKLHRNEMTQSLPKDLTNQPQDGLDQTYLDRYLQV